MKWPEPKRKRQDFDHEGACRSSFPINGNSSLTISGFVFKGNESHRMSICKVGREHFVTCSCGYGPKPL